MGASTPTKCSSIAVSCLPRWRGSARRNERRNGGGSERGMASLIAACAFFVGIHVVISGSPLRSVIVARIGERPYQGLFSSLSLAGMVWLVLAYRHADGTWLWSAPLV